MDRSTNCVGDLNGGTEIDKLIDEAKELSYS